MAILESIFTTLGTHLVNELAKTLGKGRVQAWEHIKWYQAANDYEDKVKHLYGTIRMLGQAAPVSLEGLYTDVYVLDRITAWRRFNIEQLTETYAARDLMHRREDRLNGLSMVQNNKQLFVLGKPGSGKTTFLKYIALQAIDGVPNKVPIFITLRELADSKASIPDFIVQQFAICNFPDAKPFVEKLLQEGKAIVLFDGLDEVRREDSQRMNLIADLNRFSRRYDQCHTLITCRIAATDYTFEHFTYVEMADFAEQQVVSFVGKWFSKDKGRRDKFLQELNHTDNVGLREMAHNPLLLTLLCLAFGEALAFPQRRVEIYEEALDALLKRWDASRNIQRDEIYHKLSLGRKRQLLAQVAADAFEDGLYFINELELARMIERFLKQVPPTDAIGEVDGGAVIRAIEAQHGIFVERARRIHSFAHLTFQEYFTAKYIVSHEARGTLVRLVRHVGDTRWREVFLLAASLLPASDDLFSLMLPAVNRLLNQNETILSMLSWAWQKAQRDQTSKPSIALRSVYIFVALSITLDFAISRRLARVLARASALAHAIALTLAFDLDLALDNILLPTWDEPMLHLDNTPDLDLALDLSLARTLAIALDLALGVDGSLAHVLMADVQQAMKFAKQVCNELNLLGLLQILESLHLPASDAPDTAWHSFAYALRDVMEVWRQMGQNWQLTVEEADMLVSYLEASKLLIDCMQLSVIDHRMEIENRLLLPMHFEK